MKRPGDNDPIHAPSLSDSTTLDDTSPFADIVLTSGSTAARSATRSPKDQQGQQKKGYLSTLMSAFVDKNPSPDAPSPNIDNAVLAAQSGTGDSNLSEETPSLLRRLMFFSSTSSSDQEADSYPASRDVSPRGNRRSFATGGSATPILKKVDVEKFSGVDSFTSSSTTMSADQARASGDHATDLLKEDVTANDDKNSIGFASMVS
jgi:hypothetical protein